MKLLLILLLIGHNSVIGFGTNDYYYDNWCGHRLLEYLDDRDCQKLFPSSFDREWSCPVEFTNTLPGYNLDVPIDQVNSIQFLNICINIRL